MFTAATEFLIVAEVNPPALPDMTHLDLEGKWSHVLVTDNIFGAVRVSPYAYAARVTHDVPTVHPTVVVSTRDRNILAIESEVRGAIGNGIDSFLIVVGDTLPAVEHCSHHHDIVRHLRALQHDLPAFEVGMPTRFSRDHFDRRIEIGAEFVITTPIVDPDVVAPSLDSLRLTEADPPVLVAVIPPFSIDWMAKTEKWGAVPCTDRLRGRLAEIRPEHRRAWAWQRVADVAAAAGAHGAAGAVLMGLAPTTIIGEAAEYLSPQRVQQQPRPSPVM